MPKEIIWTYEKIRDGFAKFYTERGRYPNIFEIDTYPFLPSSKQLQRRFGGVRQLREKLGLEVIDFTRGQIRSDMAAYVGKRALDSEKQIRKILLNHFGEVFVHEQKPLNSDGRSRLDFFIYAKNRKFGIDVFFVTDRHSLVGCINIKEQAYRNANFDIILLQTNPEIPQQRIDDFVRSKKNKLNPHLRVLNLGEFMKFMKTIEPLRLTPTRA